MLGITPERRPVKAVGLSGLDLPAYGSFGSIGGDALFSQVPGELPPPSSKRVLPNMQPHALLTDRFVLLAQVRKGRGFDNVRPGAWTLLLLYVVQVLLAALSDEPGLLTLRAAHVGNAALVLCVGFWVATQATQRTPQSEHGRAIASH